MAQQYEYKFVRIALRGGWWSSEVKTDYQDIIQEYATAGWRLVTIFAPAVSGYGAARIADLVFERPAV